MSAYFNEWDGPTANWLEELIRRRLIADGVVDRRSILDVSASDLKGFSQCHFFAGIGGWSYALRLAGWPDDRPVWTGSAPCQPFSSAGQQKGQDDERHLAPHFADLITEGRPPIIFGEQVASSAVFGKATSGTRKSPAGNITPEWAWLDDLFERLEAAHYACGASDIPAAGVGAAHIRQRTFFGAVRMDDPAGPRHNGPFAGPEGLARNETWLRLSGTRSGLDGLADGASPRLEGPTGSLLQGRGAGHASSSSIGRLADTSDNGRHKDGQRVTAPQRDGFVGDSAVERMGLADGQGLQGYGQSRNVYDTARRQDQGRHGSTSGVVERLADSNGRQRQRPNAPDSPWGVADWLFCRDGKWRPVEPSTFPLANGVSARVGRLRGYGNAIVPQAAAEFVKAFVDTLRSSPDFVHCKSPLPLVNSTKRNIEDLI